MSPQVFNEYLSTIGSKLHTTFDETTQLHWSLPNSSHQFKFKQLSVDEVCSHISKLSDVSKTDVLGFDAKLLRNASSEFHPVFLYYSTNHYFFSVYPMTRRKPESHPFTKVLALWRNQVITGRYRWSLTSLRFLKNVLMYS